MPKIELSTETEVVNLNGKEQPLTFKVSDLITSALLTVPEGGLSGHEMGLRLSIKRKLADLLEQEDEKELVPSEEEGGTGTEVVKTKVLVLDEKEWKTLTLAAKTTKWSVLSETIYGFVSKFESLKAS